ncbi:hypothetical protein KR067_001672 [Drosophila pandora]|nr:hypothetical protein KR067_001672 [Drosophila pandora]
MEESHNISDTFKEQVQQQAVMDSVRQMLDRICDNCFRKCVDRPSEALQAKEQRCLSMCMDRFMDSYNLVARTFQRRLERETAGEW